jgi:hypothetical protein
VGGVEFLLGTLAAMRDAIIYYSDVLCQFWSTKRTLCARVQ